MNTFERIYEVVKRIPKGKVSTYGAVASIVGIRNPRVVGYALHSNPEPYIIPCHRIVNRKGELAKAFVFGGIQVQEQLLREEGVEVVDGVVNMDKYFYFPKGADDEIQNGNI